MKKFLIKVNGHAYEVEVEEVRDNTTPTKVVETVKPKTTIPPAPVPAAAPAPKPAAPARIVDVPSGAATITSPMPGTILKVNVATGDLVKKGQVLLILEAMKMENEIVAPKDGTIASVNVEKGKTVNVGDVMISIA
jgi:glutaconyl-CoA/methylmalonyl-CoA decarboxylase subunit gamma